MDRKVSYKHHPDDEFVDEINIKIIPRYKSSELSGDEWRVSAQVEYRRKGKVLYTDTEGYRNIKYAVQFLLARFIELREDGKFQPPSDDEEFCFQPGCPDKGDVEYRLKSEHCRFCGEQIGPFHWEARRRFCQNHARRGDCGIEDADNNYERV